jgi:hypothetical protein
MNDLVLVALAIVGAVSAQSPPAGKFTINLNISI